MSEGAAIVGVASESLRDICRLVSQRLTLRLEDARDVGREVQEVLKKSSKCISPFHVLKVWIC